MIRTAEQEIFRYLKYIFGAVIIIAALKVQPGLSEPKDTSPEKLRVGMLLTLSGSFASAGEDCRLGIEAALDLSGARNSFDLLYADSKSDPTTAIIEFRRLTQIERAIAVYTHRGPIGMAVNPVSLQSGTPLLGAVGNKEFAAGNKYSIQVWPRSDDEGQFLANEFMRRGHKRAALIYTEDDWTGAVSGGFREKYLALGGSLLLDQSVLPMETDFRSILLRVKQLSPDAIYMNVLLPQIAQIAKQAREMKLAGALFSNFYVAKKDVLEAAGVQTLENFKYVEMETDLPILKRKLGLGAGVNPPGLTLASYVGTMLLTQAASDKNGPSSTEDFRSSLLRQREIRTPDFVYPIEDRYVKFPLVIKTVRNGKGQKTAD